MTRCLFCHHLPLWKWISHDRYVVRRVVHEQVPRSIIGTVLESASITSQSGTVRTRYHHAYYSYTPRSKCAVSYTLSPFVNVNAFGSHVK
jgi:hypothetical protein